MLTFLSRLPLRVGLSGIIFGFVAGLDQISKLWILSLAKSSALGLGIPYPVTPYFNLVLVYNRGITFGIFNDGATQILVLLFTLALLIFVAWYLSRINNFWQFLSLVFVFSGGCSNFFDRLFRPGVVDFLDFHWHDYHWPSFNFADVVIVCGLLTFLLFSFLQHDEQP